MSKFMWQYIVWLLELDFNDDTIFYIYISCIIIRFFFITKKQMHTIVTDSQ
jgi:hypothetical protein